MLPCNNAEVSFSDKDLPARGRLRKRVNGDNLQKGDDRFMHDREQELVGVLSEQCENLEDVHGLAQGRKGDQQVRLLRAWD